MTEDLEMSNLPSLGTLTVRVADWVVPFADAVTVATPPWPEAEVLA